MKKFNIFGALAQLVEQWPFKPFVTGSNPVRPKILNFLLIILFSFSSQYTYANDNILVQITNHNDIVLNGNYLKHDHSDSVYLIVHGTRGFKGMEIINSLGMRIFDAGHDVLSINLSYGYSNRADSFLPCDIEHQHNEHDSVNEVILWYKYLLNKDYKNISFVGHSRGGLNILQASLLLDERHNLYLLAPIIDTYEGTSQYYSEVHNLPYDEVINSSEEFIISDRYPSINFLFCENADVSSKTFRSYLDFSSNIDMYPFTFNIIELLNDTKDMVTIFSGTDDEILLDSYKKIIGIKKLNIKHHIIEGGDHFFRDIYLDDVMEIMFE